MSVITVVKDIHTVAVWNENAGGPIKILYFELLSALLFGDAVLAAAKKFTGVTSSEGCRLCMLCRFVC